MEAWYLIYTKPRQERVARDNLERQGFRSYLPLVAARRRRAQPSSSEALFPRYLFVRLTAGRDDWRPIRSTLGVAALVSFGEVPARVPDGLVDALRARENEAGLVDMAAPVLGPGDRVRIVEGAMAGLEGVFQSRGGQGRVVILLELVGAFNRVQLPAGSLERVC